MGKVVVQYDRILVDGPVVGYLWSETALRKPVLDLEALLEVQPALDEQVLHRLYFWSQGQPLPEYYQCFGRLLGGTGGRVYYRGRPVYPRDLDARERDQCRASLSGAMRHTFEAWLALAPIVRLQPTGDWVTVQGYARLAYVQGWLFDDQRRPLVTLAGEPTEYLADWVAQHSLEEIRSELLRLEQSTGEYSPRRLRAVLSHKVAPDRDPSFLWTAWTDARGDAWGLYFEERRESGLPGMWLVGPEFDQVIPDRSDRAECQAWLKAGLLAPHNPTVLWWLEAVSGCPFDQYPGRLPDRIELAEEAGVALLHYWLNGEGGVLAVRLKGGLWKQVGRVFCLHELDALGKCGYLGGLSQLFTGRLWYSARIVAHLGPVAGEILSLTQDDIRYRLVAWEARGGRTPYHASSGKAWPRRWRRCAAVRRSGWPPRRYRPCSLRAMGEKREAWPPDFFVRSGGPGQYLPGRHRRPGIPLRGFSSASGLEPESARTGIPPRW